MLLMAAKRGRILKRCEFYSFSIFLRFAVAITSDFKLLLAERSCAGSRAPRVSGRFKAAMLSTQLFRIHSDHMLFPDANGLQML
jgi:hypothetical protein